jgi:hypothetical protein
MSPQFHVRFDDVFETVKGTIDALHGRWKVLCGFTSSDTCTEIVKEGKADVKGRKGQSERESQDDQRPRKTRPMEDIEDTGNSEYRGREFVDTLSQNEGEPFQNEGDPFQNEGASEPNMHL